MAAVFSLAYKLQPSIIFINEVDSFLGQRHATENEVITNMKTEFMALWDGFTTDCEYSCIGNLLNEQTTSKCLIFFCLLVSRLPFNRLFVLIVIS